MHKEPGIVLVKRAGVDGPVRVDEAEYNANPSAFELWDTAPAGDGNKAPAYLVKKDGKRFLVIDTSGNEVERAGIDAGGYKHEADAWAAIAAIKD